MLQSGLETDSYLVLRFSLVGPRRTSLRAIAMFLNVCDVTERYSSVHLPLGQVLLCNYFSCVCAENSALHSLCCPAGLGLGSMQPCWSPR